MTNEELRALLRSMGHRALSPDTLAHALGSSPEAIAAAAIMGPITKALFDLAASIAETGHDPAEVIARIAEVKPWLDATEAHWSERIARKPT